MKKKVLSVLLASAMVASLAACGESAPAETTDSSASTEAAPATEAASTEATTETAEAEPYVLEDLYIVVDGTLTATVDSGQDKFIEQWEEKVGEYLGHDIKLTIEQPEHSGYQAAVSQMLSTRTVGDDDYPDAMIMSASMFREYSTTGLLWNMSSAYENADFYSRMRFHNNDTLNKDGEMYGFAPTRGNGCVTYVKKQWLDAVDMKLEDIKTFDDYYAMLKAFTEQDPDGNGKAGTYGVIAAKYANIGEAPYINYTAEFWQGAYPAILQRDGVWVDGFQEQATIDALTRLHQAYEDGVIDPDTEEASTKIAREKFWSNDQSVASGTFAYWAGNWYYNIISNMMKQDLIPSEDAYADYLVMLPPIKEITDTWGGYIDREAPVWVIMDDGDGDDAREQAIFDALFETMMDGDAVETLWVYGAEDVHWSIHAEEFTTNADDAEKKKDYSYAEGEFHLKQAPTDPNSIWKKNHLDPLLVVCPLTNGYVDDNPIVTEGADFFDKYCVAAPESPASETLTAIQSELTDAKLVYINEAVTGVKTPQEAVAAYVEDWGDDIKQVLDELNAQ